jgi:hypothetical protein
MRRHLTTGPLFLAFAFLCAGATALFAQTLPPQHPSSAAPPSSSASSPSSPQQDDAPPPHRPLPVDVARVKQQIEQQPAVKLDEQQLRFYVLILAKEPKFQDFVGSYDLKNGPTRGGAPMTHQEFMNMVTPHELNELFGATSGSSFALAQAAAMNVAAQSLISKAVQEIRQAHNEREVQSIRERIDKELAALLGK